MKILFFIIALGMARAQTANDDLAIIVHKDNPITRLSQATLRGIYLKESKLWPDTSESITPIDRAMGSSEREIFLRVLMKKSAAEIERYWIGQKQITGSVAPQSVGSDRLLIMMVKSIKGSVGYIRSSSLSDTDRSNVKVAVEIKNAP